MVSITEYQKALGTKANLESLSVEIPQQIIQIIEEYENQKPSCVSTPIYNTLAANNKFGVSAEKARCIEETVDELLSEADNADEPGLLLGKIQCGKTDTFEMIVGLAFDKGFDYTIVLTKNSNALARQTVSRLQGDFKAFERTNDLNQTTSIVITDIMNCKGTSGLNRLRNNKAIIVAKKEATNMKHLINLVDKNDWMKSKRILIVDDEADFASRNYRSVKPEAKFDETGASIAQTKGIALARISQLIDELRMVPKYCRYLQVTATPYSLFLQPDGKIDVVGGVAMPFRPRFTKLVPIHDRYIGGQQYFEDSKYEDSMFYHLFVPVTDKCVNVLGHQYRRYLTRGIASDNIKGVTQTLITYLMATAVRRIQSRSEGKSYKSSAVFHVNVDKNNHAWQHTLIKHLMR